MHTVRFYEHKYNDEMEINGIDVVARADVV